MTPEVLPAHLADGAVSVLETADARAKAVRSRQIAVAWREGNIADIGTAVPPDRPARPEAPTLVPPGQVRRRKVGPGAAGRVALLHALAHIELNAIDLAWDAVARFAGHPDLPRAFFDDWVSVGDEEALHYSLLTDRLAALGAAYGDLPAHDGLWQSALATAGDLAARLAVVPMVLEARGLDVTPTMIDKLDAAGDRDSAEALRAIYRDEVGHVAAGRRWFDHVCTARGEDPGETWQRLVRQYFSGRLKPPFNRDARDRAGLPADWYEPLAG